MASVGGFKGSSFRVILKTICLDGERVHVRTGSPREADDLRACANILKSTAREVLHPPAYDSDLSTLAERRILGGFVSL